MNTRGSEWKKWDLHVHNPFTKLNNQFNKITIDGETKTGLSDQEKLDYFCEIIERSDVSVIGITDYFDYLSSKKTIDYFHEKYPDSKKILLYNIELRLDYSVNKSGQYINIHLIFSEQVDVSIIETFLHSLKIKSSSPEAKKLISVRDLSNDAIRTVMVTIDNLIDQLRENFGDNYEDSVIVVASARNDGISPGDIKGDKKFNKDRNFTLIDDIDKKCNGIFSRGADAKHWLSTKRYNPKSKSLPTFGGCDAHSFDELQRMLGTAGKNNERTWETTWIKADPSFKGLLQTLIEPDERVKIQQNEPDSKENYHVIDRIIFQDNNFTSNEPIYLNKNLNSVIGSRSSGKSALLAYISYAIDQESTIKQLESTGIESAAEGPAAGITWEEAEDNNYIPQVIWKDPEFKNGKVIFVPQNSLFALSSRPDEITEKIKNLIQTKNPDLLSKYKDAEQSIKNKSASIYSLVNDWFDLENEIEYNKNSGDVPSDKSAIQRALDEAQLNLNKARSESLLTQEEIDDVNNYRQIKLQLTEEIKNQSLSIDQASAIINKFDTSISVSLPSKDSSIDLFNHLPSQVRDKVNTKIAEFEANLTECINCYLNEFKSSAINSKNDAEAELKSLEQKFFELDKKYTESANVKSIESKISEYHSAIELINRNNDKIDSIKDQQKNNHRKHRQH